MLTELNHIKQQEDGKTRRWFSDNDFDLIVWFEENNDIHGFQLCYDKQRIEHSLTWRIKNGFTHEKIDDGEHEPLSYKKSPIMIAAGKFDIDRVLNRFMTNSTEIDNEIVWFVTNKIAALSGSN